ncbi:MAG: T9SS type A sorting domain-containing protein [Bacteroidota bacterium]
MQEFLPRTLIILIGLIGSHLASLAQTPEGELWFHSYPLDSQHPGIWGKVDIPSGKFEIWDIANMVSVLPFREEQIVALHSLYNPTPHGLSIGWRQDTFASPVLPGEQFQSMHPSEDWLMLSSLAPPYLRAYRWQGDSLALQWSADTAEVKLSPGPMTVWDDRLYAVVGDSLHIYRAFTGVPIDVVYLGGFLWTGASYPTFIFPHEERLYVFFDFATALVRSAMISLDSMGIQPDTLFFVENNSSLFQPQWLGNRLYFGGYPTYFDDGGDSVVQGKVYNPYVLGVDQGDSAVFVFDAMAGGLQIFQHDSVLQTIAFPAHPMGAHYVALDSSGTTHIRPMLPALSWKVYPNPASDQINLRFSSPTQVAWLRVWDLQGRKVAEKAISALKTDLMWSPGDLRPGLYVLEVVEKNGRSSARKLSWRD